ncbi:MAG: LysR family transcriptional regulator [Desertimonas sp.]
MAATDPLVADLPELSIRQLRYLVAVADEPSWALAAARVGVSPSALSQGLAELERRIGVELFEAAGRRRVLRIAAAPVLDHARHVLALTRDLVAWSDRVRTGRSGRVRLGMIDVAAVVHYPDVVRAFRRERPAVDFTMSVAPSAALLDALVAAALDLAVVVEPPSPWPGVATEPLFDEPLVVVAPPEQATDDPSTWGPWVTFPRGSHTRVLILDRLRARGVSRSITAESHQPPVLVQLVRLGLGWTVLPVSDLPADVVPGPELARRRLVLASRVGAVRDPSVEEVAARLRQGTASPSSVT